MGSLNILLISISRALRTQSSKKILSRWASTFHLDSLRILAAGLLLFSSLHHGSNKSTITNLSHILQKTPNLQILYLKFCPSIKTIYPITKCPKLNHLTINSCHNIPNISILIKCPTIHTLNLFNPKFDLTFINKMPHLKNLMIDSSPIRSLTIPNISLHCLNITNCPNLSHITLSPRTPPPNLTLINCPKLWNIHNSPTIAQSQKVTQTLAITNCPKLLNKLGLED